jgi:hypothetical protein
MPVKKDAFIVRKLRQAGAISKLLSLTCSNHAVPAAMADERHLYGVDSHGQGEHERVGGLQERERRARVECRRGTDYQRLRESLLPGLQYAQADGRC